MKLEECPRCHGSGFDPDPQDVQLVPLRTIHGDAFTSIEGLACIECNGHGRQDTEFTGDT